MSSPPLASHFRGELTNLTVTPSAASPQADDLSLAAMAAAAMNYLRGNPEPSRGYECRFSLGPLSIPAHCPEWAPPNEYGYDPIAIADTDCRMETQYAHMRIMAGTAEPDEFELGVRARVEGYQRADGLSWANPVAFVGRPIEGYWANTWASSKLLFSLAERYVATGDETLKAWAGRIVEGLRSLASWDGDRAFYPGGPCPWKDGVWLREGWAASHSRNYPPVVEPLVRAWECLGDESALDLARAFTEGFLAYSQPGQGDHQIDRLTGSFRAHVHLHTHAIWGVAHLGAVLNEPRYLDYAQSVHEFVRAYGTDYGWYPEHIPQGLPVTEICVVGDMTGIAAWLARSGRTAYWDVVERTLRNTIRRSQFALTPEFVALFERVHEAKGAAVISAALEELKRYEGGFVAQPTYNDWVGHPGSLGAYGQARSGVHMMGCCPPEGMHALWEAWTGTVTTGTNGVLVNMNFTGDHEAAAVEASRPEEGRMAVKANRAADYYLRPPGWVNRESVRLNGEPGHWGGPGQAYVVAPGVAPGTALVLTWAVPRFTQTQIAYSVPGRETPVTVEWVGNEVVTVQPRGEYLPLFG